MRPFAWEFLGPLQHVVNRKRDAIPGHWALGLGPIGLSETKQLLDAAYSPKLPCAKKALLVGCWENPSLEHVWMLSNT